MDDWELLHHGSDSESTDSITSEKKSEISSLIDDGMIVSDHFSADSVDFDSSRVNYGSESLNPGEVGVVLGDECVRSEILGDGVVLADGCVRSEILGDGEVRLSDFEAANEEYLEREAAVELTGGTISQYESDDLQVADGRHVESESGVEEPIEDSSKSWFDSGGIVNDEEEIVFDSGVVSTEVIDEGNGGDIVEVGDVRSGNESKSREIVWWKMPFVLLKYSVFKIGPVWSVSMAAAVMGLVLLGRRLYNMKKKAQRFHLKVTIDDKKASRVMSQAARLNEVFTEVRRVPVIRPALPSPGAWPVLSLR